MDLLSQKAVEAYNGSNDALEFVAKESFGIAYVVSLKVTRNHHDAEDNAQEVATKSCHYLRIKHPCAYNYFDGGSTYKTWLHKVAWNSAINKKRRSFSGIISLEQEFDEGGSLIELLASEKKNPEEKLLAKEFKELVMEASGKIPLTYLFEFLLRDFEELSYEEIAEELNIPLGTVRSRIHRARTSIAQELRKIDGYKN